MNVLIFFLLFIIKKRIRCGNSTCFEYSCDECETQEYGKCTKCRKGFRLIDGTCPCSDINCALCSTGLSGINLCFLCKKGSHILTNDCYCQIDDCEICSDNGCILCKAGYFYNSTSNSCEVQKEEDKISCYDNNCDACYSSEKGACDYCKEGYVTVKGECQKLPDKIEDDTCPDGYFLSDNKCQKICYGVNCNTIINSLNKIYYTCPSNECLLCTNNVLKIFSECDNSLTCKNEGCLNCITNDECIICTQGYYLLNGICKRCPQGCSKCFNSDTCIHCLSGYELNAEKKCYYTGNLDFNLETYQNYKNELIKLYYPGEIVQITNVDSNNEKVECDENCLNCSVIDNNKQCIECNKNYILKNGNCLENGSLNKLNKYLLSFILFLYFNII